MSMNIDASTVERMHDLLDRDLPLSHDPELARLVASDSKQAEQWRHLAMLNEQIIAGTGRRASVDSDTQQLQHRVMSRIQQLRQRQSGSPVGYWRVGMAMAACLMIGVITGGAWKNLAAKQAPSDFLITDGSPAKASPHEPFFYTLHVADAIRETKKTTPPSFAYLFSEPALESEIFPPAAYSPSQLPIIETAAVDLGTGGISPAFLSPIPNQSDIEFLLFGGQ